MNMYLYIYIPVCLGCLLSQDLTQYTPQEFDYFLEGNNKRENHLKCREVYREGEIG